MELLKDLCAAPGVSSREDAVREAIRAAAAPYADEITQDALGNLLVWKRGTEASRPTVLVAAHMDEVGVMVTGYTKDGFLRFDAVGELDRRTLIGKRVYLGENRIPGVFGMKPIHLTSKEERKAVPPIGKLYLDIGAESKRQAERLSPLGTVGCFSGAIGTFGAYQVKGSALSGRVGCAVALELLKTPCRTDTCFAFTVMEEVGNRGAFGAGFRVAPEVALVLDAAAANDLPGVEEAQRGCALGKGVVLHRMDRGTVYAPALFALLRETAKAQEIPWQILVSGETDTEAAPLQRSRAGVRAAALSLPVRYAKAPTEVADLRDIDSMARLAEAFLRAVEEDNA